MAETRKRANAGDNNTGELPAATDASGDLGADVTTSPTEGRTGSATDKASGRTDDEGMAGENSTGGTSVPNPLSVAAGVGQVAVSVASSLVSALPRHKGLFYTSIAVLGLAGVVEWPVAVLVATGTYVASRGDNHAPNSSSNPGPNQGRNPISTSASASPPVATP